MTDAPSDEPAPGEDEVASFFDDYTPKGPGEVDPERFEKVAGRLRSASPGELSPRRTAIRDLAEATRLLIDRMVATDAPIEVIEAATADVTAAAARFDGFHQGSLYGISEMANAGQSDDPMFDHSPLIGIGNALSPPLTLVEEDGVVVGHVRFGQAYEGPPNTVHGGYVAAAFDEVLGAAQSLSGAPGMTGTLSVRYEAPTPLHTDLRFEGRLVGVERRKIFVEGTCTAGDVVTARAEGIFISLKSGMFMDLLREREAAQEEMR